MNKHNIKFYEFEDCKTTPYYKNGELKKTPKSKNTKLYNKILINCSILSIIIICTFYALNSYTINKLSALVPKAKTGEINNEQMNSSSDKLNSVNNNYNLKYVILINKANPINKDFIKNYKIVNVKNNAYSNIKLEENTYKNYLKLKNNLLKRGYYINITSGYRSYEESDNIYNSYCIEKGENYAIKYVAAAGTSEHNIGLSFDFVISNSKANLKTDYEGEEYKYLENIIYLYGFIIRYPKDKETITGYGYEPWHLRYVGKNLAKYLTKNNLTLEEYYEIEE